MTPELRKRLEELAAACQDTGRRDDLMVAGILCTVLGGVSDRSLPRLFAILSQYSQERVSALKNEN